MTPDCPPFFQFIVDIQFIVDFGSPLGGTAMRPNMPSGRANIYGLLPMWVGGPFFCLHTLEVKNVLSGLFSQSY